MRTPDEWCDEAEIICSSRDLDECEERCRFGCFARREMAADLRNETLETAAILLEEVGTWRGTALAIRLRSLKCNAEGEPIVADRIRPRAQDAAE